MFFLFVLVGMTCYSQLSLGMYIVNRHETNSTSAVSTSYPEISTLSSQNSGNTMAKKNTQNLLNKISVVAVRK